MICQDRRACSFQKLTTSVRKEIGVQFGSWRTYLLNDKRLTSVLSKSVVLAYIAAIGCSEVVLVFIGVIPGAIFHTILVLALLSHYVIGRQAPYGRALPALALVPFMRVLSLAVPVQDVPQIFWYAMIGVPLLLAVALTMKHLDLSLSDFGWPPSSWPLQIAIVFSGLPLSFVAFSLLRPLPLIDKSNSISLAVGSIILIIFTGFTEEVIFRGVLQRVGDEIFGRAGILYVNVLFAIMYIGSLSLVYVFFIGLLGLFFSWCVNQTKSIWGVVFAHSMLNIGLLLILP